MVLAHGGHLTHGSPVNVSGMWFNFVGYEVDRETEQLDMDQVRDLALEHRPKIILAGYTAYPRAIDFAAFREIADEVGALLMVDASHFIGLVAGGAYPSPVPHADVVTFTTHKTLRGPRGAMILCREEHAKAIDKAVFPMMQGGPLEHCIAGEGRRAEGGDDARVQGLRRSASCGPRARSPQALAEEGLRIVSGGTDSHLSSSTCGRSAMSGKDAEARRATRSASRSTRTRSRSTRCRRRRPSGIRVGTPGPRPSAWTSRR